MSRRGRHGNFDFRIFFDSRRRSILHIHCGHLVRGKSWTQNPRQGVLHHLYHQSDKSLRVNNKIGNRYEDIWSSIDTAKFYNSNLSSLSSEKRALCFEYSFSVSCFAVRGMVNGWSWWENRDELLDEEISSDDPMHNLKPSIVCSYLRSVHTLGSYEFVSVHIHYRITRILQSTRQETEGNKRRESN